MFKSSNHYLDTNIILSMAILGDNNFENADKYLKQKFHTFVSTSVCKEAEDKIDKLKIISFKIIDFINKYSSNHTINLVKINNYRFKIKKEFLNQYKDLKFPEGIKKSNFEDIVHKFFKEYENEINEILIINSDERLFLNAQKAYKINKARLYDFIEGNNCITFVSSGSKVEDFRKINAHDKDSILLDEAYHLHLSLNQPVHFITFDSDVLELKNRIFDNITEDVIVSNPIEFSPT